MSEDEIFITEEEAAELIKQGWLKQYEWNQNMMKNFLNALNSA